MTCFIKAALRLISCLRNSDQTIASPQTNAPVPDADTGTMTSPTTKISYECKGWNKIRVGHADLQPTTNGEPIGIRCQKLPANKHIRSMLTALHIDNVTVHNVAACEEMFRYAGMDTPDFITKFMEKHDVSEKQVRMKPIRLPCSSHPSSHFR